jgi:hypothetical protein
MRLPPFAPLSAQLRTSGLLLGIFLSMASGCSWMGTGRDPTASSPYQEGVLALAEGHFDAADRAFRESASACESGREGRRALLFLSLLALDPRNPGASPDSAALMATRFLQLPYPRPDEVLEAEGLYVAALDRGADPELRPDPGNSKLALRFERCGELFPPMDARPLPALERPTAGVLQSLDAERRALEAQNETLQRTVEELQAELERIRGLLRRPDTTRVRSPSGS